MTSEPEGPVQDPVTQRKGPGSGRFRLQVDRQTKTSYATTYEAAEAVGMAIKKEYPILQVTIAGFSRRHDQGTKYPFCW
jgi:hypothetical protein